MLQIKFISKCPDWLPCLASHWSKALVTEERLTFMKKTSIVHSGACSPSCNQTRQITQFIGVLESSSNLFHQSAQHLMVAKSKACGTVIAWGGGLKLRMAPSTAKIITLIFTYKFSNQTQGTYWDFCRAHQAGRSYLWLPGYSSWSHHQVQTKRRVPSFHLHPTTWLFHHVNMSQCCAPVPQWLCQEWLLTRPTTYI